MKNNSPKPNHQKKNHKLSLLAILLFTLICFGLGVFLPIATIEKFYLFKNEFSLLDSLIKLLTTFSIENSVLFVILFLFTFCFPLLKLAVIFHQIIKPHSNKNPSLLFKWVSHLAQLSMVDVFVIALMVLLLKLEVLVSVSVHSGFYFFTASVLLALVLTLWVKKRN